MAIYHVFAECFEGDQARDAEFHTGSDNPVQVAKETVGYLQALEDGEEREEPDAIYAAFLSPYRIAALVMWNRGEEWKLFIDLELETPNDFMAED